VAKKPKWQFVFIRYNFLISRPKNIHENQLVALMVPHSYATTLI